MTREYVSVTLTRAEEARHDRERTLSSFFGLLYFMIPGVIVAVAVGSALAWAVRHYPHDQPADVGLLSLWFPLTVAPLAAAVILTLGAFLNVPVAVVPWLALRVAPFCYATEFMFVLPVMLVWHPARRPGFVVAALWGAVAATCSLWSLELLYLRNTTPFRSGMDSVAQMSAFWIAGALGGVSYVWLVRRVRA